MNRRGGSVLILAMWVLFFLTALAVAVGSQVGAMLTLAGFVRDHVALRALGQAAAMQSAAVISGQTNAWDGVTEDSWTRDTAAFTVEDLSGSTGRTGFVVRDERSVVTNTGVLSESGRINLNTANERLLAAYFGVAGGLSSVDAEDLAKAVRARIGADDAPLTAPAGDGYAAGGLAASAGGPFVMVEELQGLSGVTPHLFRRLSPGLTVFGDGLINVNAASREVLHGLALSVADEPRVAEAAASLAERIVRFRENGNAFTVRDSEAMKAAFYAEQNVPSEEKQCFERMTGRLTVASTHFRGITYGQRDGATRETAAQEFVFDNRKSEKRFVYWREF